MRCEAFPVALLLLWISAFGCGGGGFRPPKETASQTRASAKDGSGASPLGKNVATPRDAKPDQVGHAGWYGGVASGKKTANGERFDPNLFTAAHRTLPFGTWVEVRRVDTGSTVRVRINDRGPFGHSDGIIDLSRKAAEELDIVRDGGARVELRVVSGP